MAKVSIAQISTPGNSGDLAKLASTNPGRLRGVAQGTLHVGRAAAPHRSYSLIGRLKGLAELRGIELAVRQLLP